MKKLLLVTATLLAYNQTALCNKLLEATKQLKIEEVESILDQKNFSEDERFQAESHVKYTLGYSKTKLPWYKNYKAILHTIGAVALALPFGYLAHKLYNIDKPKYEGQTGLPKKDNSALLAGTILCTIPALGGISQGLKAYKGFTKPPYNSDYILNLALKGLLQR